MYKYIIFYIFIGFMYVYKHFSIYSLNSKYSKNMISNFYTVRTCLNL